ncbi:UDP-N-acetylmuramoyl-L-alanyl-D-glutamate--2,6-diaminopimelate ligase [Candidatus Peregrinibacteria bacterium]|nr:UDP-N-acetylmuramoyl-L-alanyl-D-glutamate--2,6-diaminopimelate ligase [Candidatus Peregrinibacteria bacterium]
MIAYLRRFFPDTHPFRLFYHRIMAVLAAFVYWFPADRLKVIAVTGTHGKTTTTNLIAHILEISGEKVGLSSTICFKIGKKKWTNLSKQTTVSPFQLQKLLRNMVNAGCTYAVIETSSHAMTQSRLWGVNVDMAVLTNIGRDHIEYHGSFRTYVEAKLQLFSLLMTSRRKPNISKISVLNRESEAFEYFNSFVPDRVITYGFTQKADYRVENLEVEADSSRFIFKIPNDEISIHLKIPGTFNVWNALAAATASLACGVKLPIIKNALESARSFPGRLESIDEGQNFAVIVDYAHTTESLEELLRMFRKLVSGRIFIVFGATGGGRDKAKRPKMGQVAHKYSDCIILTNDDPYDEDEHDIIEQIAHGIPRKEGENFWKIIDRKEAIRSAISLAKKGDVVIIAGKGCEEFMMLKGKKVPHDDRRVAREILRALK